MNSIDKINEAYQRIREELEYKFIHPEVRGFISFGLNCFLRHSLSNLRVVCDRTINHPEVIANNMCIAELYYFDADKMCDCKVELIFGVYEFKVVSIPLDDPQTGESNPNIESKNMKFKAHTGWYSTSTSDLEVKYELKANR